MKRRRGNGEGTIVRRPDGRWMGQITLGRGPDGRLKRLTVYGRTRQEVAAKLAELAAAHHKGLLPSPEAITLREWALRWLERKAKEVRPRSLTLYRLELAYALPSLRDPTAPDPLGSMRLQAVQPVHVKTVLDNLLDRGLALRTVRKVREKLSTLFEEALALELVPRNPVAPIKVKAPREAPRDRAGRTLERGEVAALLAALDAHSDRRTAMALRLMLACGLRRGEALGLQWADVDLEEGVLRVVRSWSSDGTHPVLTMPKTATSRREVPIPHATLERLRAYRAWWQEAFGDSPTPPPWLFPSLADPSRPMDPNAPNHLLRRLCDRLGLPRIRVHDLRHTYGSLLLASGAPVELVAERMGHSAPTVTLNVYRHLLQEERRGWVLDPEDLAGPRGRA